MKSVAILGCGPAGLLVAHAAVMSGWDFRIYSRKQPSKLYGAQYLHAAIPGLDTGTPKLVRYELRGTPEAYRRKVYGDDWDGTVSPEDYMEAHNAWDIRTAYQQLWEQYGDEIVHFEVDQLVSSMSGLVWFPAYDLVISTVPRKLWAAPGDVFESVYIWALGDTEMVRVEPAYRPEPFSVVCESDWRVPWYRVSNIFGYCTVEWPYNEYGQAALRKMGLKELGPPVEGASLVEKPLRHNSTAASDFIHLGRFAQWEKGVLSTDAFFSAMKVFAMDTI